MDPLEFYTPPTYAPVQQPSKRALFTQHHGPLVLMDPTMGLEALAELQKAVRVAFHNLKQMRAAKDHIAASHEEWAATLQQAVDKVVRVSESLVKTQCTTDDALARRVTDIAYYTHHMPYLLARADAIKEELLSKKKQAELQQLKEVVAQVDAMSQDKIAADMPKTDLAREFIDIAVENFKSSAYPSCPKPLPPRAGDEPLPPEADFRTGKWLATTWGVGYSKVADSIEYLRSIALRLHNDELASYDLLKSTQSSIQLVELKKLLEEHKVLLKQYPRSNQVHAAWYYLKALEGQVHVVEASLARKATPQLEAARSVLHAITSPDSLIAYYEACISCSTDATLGPVLAKIGTVRLALTDDEKAIVPQLFAGVAVDQALLLSYLMKLLISARIFSRKNGAELELVLMKLKIAASPLLQQPEVARLLADYLQDFPITADAQPALAILASLHARRAADVVRQALALDRFMRLYQARIELQDVPAQWRSYIEKGINETGQKWQEDIDVKKMPEGLYTQLFTYFFSDDEHRKLFANDAILREIKTVDSATLLVQAMLFCWALERFREHSLNKPNALVSMFRNLALSDEQQASALREKAIVRQLFDAYQNRSEIRAFFILRYGQKYMEEAYKEFEASNKA